MRLEFRTWTVIGVPCFLVFCGTEPPVPTDFLTTSPAEVDSPASPPVPPPAPPPPRGEVIEGIRIQPEDDIQSYVESHPPGTTFIVGAGIYRRQSVIPKNGMSFIGEAGAVLDGENAVEHAFRGDKHSGAPNGVNDVTVKGLEIRNYNSPLRQGAIRAGGPNDTEASGWLIEGCNIHHNAGGGIRTGHRMVIRNNNIHHNGQIGIIGSGDNILVEGNEIAYNNTRDIFNTVGLYEAGGTKFVNTRNLVVRNNYVHDNLEDGLWFDIDNIDALIEGNRVIDNSRTGIHWEISYDAVIRNNYVEGNAFAEDMWHRGGIRISSSPNVEVYGNTLVDNANGIVALTQDRGTGDYGEREIKNLYVHDNEIRQSGGVMTGLGLGGHDAPEYYTSMGNRWERNTYKTSNAADVRWHWDSGKVQWDPWKSSHPEDGPLN